jgi:hypothetical protein
LAGQQTVKLKNTLEKRAFQLSTTDKGWTFISPHRGQTLFSVPAYWSD